VLQFSKVLEIKVKMASLQSLCVIQMFENAPTEELLVWLRHLLPITLSKDEATVKTCRKMLKQELTKSKMESRRQFIEKYFLLEKLDPSVHNRRLTKVTDTGTESYIWFSLVNERAAVNKHGPINLVVSLSLPKWWCYDQGGLSFTSPEIESYVEDMKLVEKVERFLICHIDHLLSGLLKISMED
jgi:hypothetical protein